MDNYYIRVKRKPILMEFADKLFFTTRENIPSHKDSDQSALSVLSQDLHCIALSLIWPQGYNTFFLLNSTEDEI